mmetsp:Transcript_29286/g.21798  ORF Transcript_29286/g.21798 Transcript_29286/m.21798 type:complete len:134 (+) Transcript_29286:64-465(+)
MYSTVFWWALTVLFWYFAKCIEVDVVCYASPSSNFIVEANAEGAVDVNRRFQVLLVLYFWSCFIEMCKELMVLAFYKFNMFVLAYPICILKMNVIVLFLAFILTCVFRQQHVGKVCSGDFLPTVHDEAEGYLL